MPYNFCTGRNFTDSQASLFHLQSQQQGAEGKAEVRGRLKTVEGPF